MPKPDVNPKSHPAIKRARAPKAAKSSLRTRVLSKIPTPKAPKVPKTGAEAKAAAKAAPKAVGRGIVTTGKAAMKTGSFALKAGRFVGGKVVAPIGAVEGAYQTGRAVAEAHKAHKAGRHVRLHAKAAKKFGVKATQHPFTGEVTVKKGTPGVLSPKAKPPRRRYR
jgi:ribosomal protein S20